MKYFVSSFSLSDRFRISCLLNLSLLTVGIAGVLAHLTIEYFMCVCDIISSQGDLNIAEDDLELLILVCASQVLGLQVYITMPVSFVHCMHGLAGAVCSACEGFSDKLALG